MGKHKEHKKKRRKKIKIIILQENVFLFLFCQQTASSEEWKKHNGTTKIRDKNDLFHPPRKEISETIDQPSCRNYEVSYPKRRKGKQARPTMRYAIV